MNWNYNHLYYFYITANTGNVTAAAQTLGIQQPSLTSQLKKLEYTMDRKLFERSGRSIRLSRQGKELQELCHKIFENSEALSTFIKEKPEAAKKIKLGISNDLERPFMIDLVSKVFDSKTKSNHYSWNVYSDDHRKIIQQLREGKSDFILTAKPETSPDIKVILKTSLPVVLITPKGTAVNKKYTVQDLKKISWILPSDDSELRSQTDQFFKKMDIQPDILLESNNISALIRAVARGLGFALLPLNYLQTQVHHQMIRVVKTDFKLWSHDLWLMSLSSCPESDLITQIKQAFAIES